MSRRVSAIAVVIVSQGAGVVGGERLTRRQGVGIACAFGAMALIVGTA